MLIRIQQKPFLENVISDADYAYFKRKLNNPAERHWYFVYPHSFRHRFAKNFLEKFNDISLLADLMGHESIETTRIYLRRTSTEQRGIVDHVVTW